MIEIIRAASSKGITPEQTDSADQFIEPKLRRGFC
jgi:hypothetical protein